MSGGFGARLQALADERGRLCVGLDPHEPLVRAWGLDYDAAGIERLARDTVAALADEVMVFKPQSAFFEVFGSRGVAALGRVLDDIRAAGALSILDVKRGDIGSTMSAYARAYLSDDAELRADAITLSPYLGFEALRPAIDLAHATGRGLFVLCHTSNPEGEEVQFATHGGHTIAQGVVDHAQAENTEHGLDDMGLVIGATHDNAGVDLSGFTGWTLAPGIGAQGARWRDCPPFSVPVRITSSRAPRGEYCGPDRIVRRCRRPPGHSSCTERFGRFVISYSHWLIRNLFRHFEPASQLQYILRCPPPGPQELFAVRTNQQVMEKPWLSRHCHPNNCTQPVAQQRSPVGPAPISRCAYARATSPSARHSTWPAAMTCWPTSV